MTSLQFLRLILLAMLACAALSSCKGDLASSQDSRVQDPAPQVRSIDRPTVLSAELQPAQKLDGPAALALPQLASPRDMLSAADRSASFTLPDGLREAALYSQQLPSNRVSPSGSNLTFQPNFSPGNSGLERMAYAVYSFDLPDYAGRYVEVSTDWGATPGAGLGYVALGNFATGRWDWYGDPSSEALHFEDFNPYIDAGTDTCLVVVAVRGTAICRLDMLQIYTPQPPSAVLGSDVDSGLTPLDVFFDGSGSVDTDGSVTGFEWDLDGDGTFGESGEEANAAGQSTVSKQFADPGAVTVSLRVTDNDGLTGTDSLIINANLAPNDQPIALLGADPLSGPAPLEVSFDASTSSDPDGSIVAWEWDFDGDGNFGEADNGEQAAADNPQPAAVSYVDPGEYNPAVRITDNGGAMDSASVAVSVQQAGAVTAVLESDFSAGDAPLSINFDGSNSLGAITDYEWDFDGDGVFNETGAEATAQGLATPDSYLFATPNLWTVSLRVSDSLGNNDTDSVIITAHGWAVVEMPETGPYPSIASINGHPAICHHSYVDGNSQPTNTLRYYYSNSLTGALPEDWSDPVSVETAVQTSGWQSSLLEVQGRPAIFYYSTSNQNVFYERAATATGTGSSDWDSASLLIDSAGGQTYYGFKGAIISGNPAVAWNRGPENDSILRYARSTTATGDLIADWGAGSKLTIDQAGGHNVGRECWLAMVNGTPAISYEDDFGGTHTLKYAHSSTPDGYNIADWTIVTVSSSENPQYTSLLEVGGAPAIAYKREGTFGLIYRRASTASGNASADWDTGTNLLVASGGPVGSFASLNIVNGHIAITHASYSNPYALFYKEATTLNGTSQAEWDNGISETADSGESSLGEWMECVVCNGRPICVYRGVANQLVRFCVRI